MLQFLFYNVVICVSCFRIKAGMKGNVFLNGLEWDV